MNVVIIEDEPYAVDRLELLLKECKPSASIIQTLDSISGAISYLKEGHQNVDLLFLDVELADGLCFEIFDEVQINIPTIFTTAYDSYAIKAFDLNSVHYLLKPIQKEDLQKALDKYEKIEQSGSLDLLAVKQLINHRGKSYKRHFLGRFGNKLMHKPIEDVAYFFSEDGMVYLVDKNRKKFLIDFSLDELSNGLLDPEIFYRVSRKFIVSIQSVEMLSKYFNQRLKLSLYTGQEHEIVVSREKVTDFKMWLNK